MLPLLTGLCPCQNRIKRRLLFPFQEVSLNVMLHLMVFVMPEPRISE